MKMRVLPFFLLLIFSLLLSCDEKAYFKEIISEKEVSISSYGHNGEKGYFLNIPIEFSINLNQKDIKDVRIYYVANGELAMRVGDYLVYNGDTDEIIFAIEDLEYGEYPKSIYIIDRRFALTPERLTELLNEYSPRQSLSSLKDKNDFIPLTSYKQFREDHPKFLQSMREEPDSLYLSIGFSKGRRETFRKKINW